MKFTNENGQIVTGSPLRACGVHIVVSVSNIAGKGLGATETRLVARWQAVDGEQWVKEFRRLGGCAYIDEDGDPIEL